MKSELIYTNENCIGCNKCVRICYSFGASVSHNHLDNSSIQINYERCIGCGACIDVCKHQARDYHDDTEQFFEDLKKGESISLLVAPSFEAKYPEEYRRILGVLKGMGVKCILPVALGADICTWAYIKMIREKGYTGRIATPCPVVVSYIEHWMPDLIPKLMPVKSPLMCAATYFRDKYGVTDRFAFIGPCIAKSTEVEKYPELVQYNITFPKLVSYIKENRPEAEESFEDVEAGLGAFYPAPGGLADNIRWFLGDDTKIRVVSGKTYLYQMIRKNRDKADDLLKPYTLLDALNCREGCIEGTAKTDAEDREEPGLAEIHGIRKAGKHKKTGSPWMQELSFEERLENLNKQFEDLDISDYTTTFTDQSGCCRVSLPTKEEAEAVYLTMRKEDEASREINCSACGYETCEEMMIAIHNGFNTRRNCVYFEKEEAIYLTKMSFSDQLTGVMNRNAYEKKQESMYAPGKPLGIILTDVNGLKQANDTIGHNEGDRLIIETAHAFANEFGTERVFRTGGDEFIIILQDFDKKEIEADLDLVKKHLKKKNVSVAVGFSFTDDYEGEIDALIETADKRMYDDKNRYYDETGMPKRKKE